jgi:hypothetical protein
MIRSLLNFTGRWFPAQEVHSSLGISKTKTKSTWKPNFSQIGGFLYFVGHFGFKMATMANQNGRHMVQYVILHVNVTKVQKMLNSLRTADPFET